ncbi:hypothetical protein [Rickettsiella endosymbiont of Rhagonycha lignosa]|uniref:hypothetical protein n=1 Tax=Rickettsiella endosymbiont of Rhagonycha lignosa TaxID=3077937 RepID=UPI00313B3B34
MSNFISAKDISRFLVVGMIAFILVAPLTAVPGVGIMLATAGLLIASAFMLMILPNLIEITGISRLFTAIMKKLNSITGNTNTVQPNPNRAPSPIFTSADSSISKNAANGNNYIYKIFKVEETAKEKDIKLGNSNGSSMNR